MARRPYNAKAKRDVRLSTQARVSQAKAKASTRYLVPVQSTQRLHRSKIQRIIVKPTIHPKQPVNQPVLKRGNLRITVRPTECRIRKKYKKKMLKSIAAQIKRSGGNMSSWRKKRAYNRRIVYRC